MGQAINRREYLKSAAAMAGMAGIAVVRSDRVFGAQANGRIKLGVIGCGGRGPWIARLFAEHGGYEMYAVADYFQEVADRCGDALEVDAGRRFSGLSGYKRLMESGVEAVALETPPYCFPDHVAGRRGGGAARLHGQAGGGGCARGRGHRRGRKAWPRDNECFLVDYQMPTDPFNLEIAANRARTASADRRSHEPTWRRLSRPAADGHGGEPPPALDLGATTSTGRRLPRQRLHPRCRRWPVGDRQTTGGGLGRVPHRPARTARRQPRPLLADLRVRRRDDHESRRFPPSTPPSMSAASPMAKPATRRSVTSARHSCAAGPNRTKAARSRISTRPARSATSRRFTRAS